MDKKGIKPLIPFIRKIEEDFSPARIILFGSRARGDCHKDSDYDLIIVADSFKKMNFHDRAASIYHIKRIPVSVDVICYTPEEFAIQSKQLGIVNQALKEGIDVLEIFRGKRGVIN